MISHVACALLYLATSPPAAKHAVLLERAPHRQLEELTNVVQAELRAAGFEVREAQPAASLTGEVPEDGALVRLALVEGRARLTARTGAQRLELDAGVDDVASRRKDANRLALQISEWLAALWLSPPELAPDASPLSPPPFATPVAAPVSSTLAVETPRPERSSSRAVSVELGLSGQASPSFGGQMGLQGGITFRRARPGSRWAFWLRPTVGVLWLASTQKRYEDEEVQLRFVPITCELGLARRFSERWGIEAGLSAGLVAVFWQHSFVANPAAESGDPWRVYDKDHAWSLIGGPTAAASYDLDARLSLVIGAHTSWILRRQMMWSDPPGQVDFRVPAFGVTVSARVSL